MNLVSTRGSDVAKKKSEKPAASEQPAARPAGTLIRVTRETAEALSDVVGLEKMSTAEWIEQNLLPIIRERYEDALSRKYHEMAVAKKRKEGDT